MTTFPATFFGSASRMAFSVPDQAVASTATSANLAASPGLATEPLAPVCLTQSLSLSSSGLRVPILTSWPRVAKPVPSAWPTTHLFDRPFEVGQASGDFLARQAARRVFDDVRSLPRVQNELQVDLAPGEDVDAALHFRDRAVPFHADVVHPWLQRIQAFVGVRELRFLLLDDLAALDR